jgi:hypothetical protein
MPLAWDLVSAMTLAGGWEIYEDESREEDSALLYVTE